MKVNTLTRAKSLFGKDLSHLDLTLTDYNFQSMGVFWPRR
ncbi:hypothetical protein D082_10890 [Synechocystis sp. PCC 6714]|nr:hypothetical protein D082_10890 [Synechocystis sp. PCC 6714]